MNEEQKTFPCVLCDCKLDSKEALQEHFRKHANKVIDAKGNTSKQHAIPKPKAEEKHDAEEKCDKPNTKIACDVCPMEFDTVTLAIQHKFRKHPTSSIKYFCPFCGMQFPLKFTRDKHVETHKNDSTSETFPCPECGIIFHTSQAQNYHFKSTHKRIMSIFKPVPTPPPSKKIKINNANEAQSVYYCYLCGMEYIIKFNLQKHLERSHTDEERNKVPENLIKCTTCDALFYNKKAYDNHNMYHKPDDLYVTSEEQRLQTVTRVDQDFDIRRVQLVTDKFIPVDKPKSRRQVLTKKVQLKKNKNCKQATDDELSPTSSIESSDSEDENTLNQLGTDSEKIISEKKGSNKDSINTQDNKSNVAENLVTTATKENNITETNSIITKEKVHTKKQSFKRPRN